MRFGRFISVAALAAATSLVSAAALSQDAIQAGVSAAVRGDVQIARADAVGRQVNSGEAIFLQDAIASGSDGGMQILLLDQTVFTIGPESEIAIDEFVYDPNTGQGSLAANMVKGTMRFVTGNIAAGTPENMSIKLPVGTIGIRGTNGVVSVLTQEQAQQQFPAQTNQLGAAPGQPIIFAALNGPGPLSNTGSGTGSFNFSTPNGDVDLNRPGAAVLAAPDAPPIFFLAPPGSIQQVTNGLRSDNNDDEGDGSADGNDGGAQPQAQDGDGGGDQSDGDNNNAADGEDGDNAGGTQTASNDGPPGTGGGDSGSNAVSQSGVSNDVSFNQATTSVEVTDTSSNATNTVNEIASDSTSGFTFADLGALSGSATFVSSTTNYGGGAGLSISSFSIGFSARDVNFEGSVNGGNVHTGASSPAAVSWAGLTGNAIITIGQGSAGNVPSNTGCSQCSVSLDFQSGSSVNVTATGTTGTTNVTINGN